MFVNAFSGTYAWPRAAEVGIITGFICASIPIMLKPTSNQPFEVAATTAAYVAVLVVFIHIDEKGGTSDEDDKV
jgi:cobalamin synthase